MSLPGCKTPKPHVVTFIEHRTWEISIEALSPEAATERAIELRRRSGLKNFTLIEVDDTDWSAAKNSRELLPMIDHAPAPPASSTPAPRYMSTQELQTVVRLLRELRDLTQSRSSFADANRMISLILNVDAAR